MLMPLAVTKQGKEDPGVATPKAEDTWICKYSGSTSSLRSESSRPIELAQIQP